MVNEVVGWVEERSDEPTALMGIVESILRELEGLNPSYDAAGYQRTWMRIYPKTRHPRMFLSGVQSWFDYASKGHSFVWIPDRSIRE